MSKFANQGVKNIMGLMGQGIGFMGGMQQARGLEAAGKMKAAAYADLAAQYDTRALAHIPLAQRKALETKRLTKIMESDARAKLKGGASDPSSIKLLAELRTQGFYQAALQMVAGEQAAENERARGRYARIAGSRAAAAGKIKAHAARTGAFMGLLKGMGKNITLARKYGDTEAAAPWVNPDLSAPQLGYDDMDWDI